MEVLHALMIKSGLERPLGYPGSPRQSVYLDKATCNDDGKSTTPVAKSERCIAYNVSVTIGIGNCFLLSALDTTDLDVKYTKRTNRKRGFVLRSCLDITNSCVNDRGIFVGNRLPR